MGNELVTLMSGFLGENKSDVTESRRLIQRVGIF